MTVVVIAVAARLEMIPNTVTSFTLYLRTAIDNSIIEGGGSSGNGWRNPLFKGVHLNIESVLREVRMTMVSGVMSSKECILKVSQCLNYDWLIQYI